MIFPFLKGLKYNPYEIRNIHFLSRIPSLEKLYLGFPGNPPISLTILNKFEDIDSLHFSGDFGDMNNINHLPLRSFSISYSKSFDCNQLKGFSKLQKLRINNINDLQNHSSIQSLKKLEYLELHSIDNLDNLDFIFQLNNLQYLRLGRLSSVKKLPDLTGCSSLRRITLVEMEILKDVSSISKVDSLEELSAHDCDLLEVSDFYFLRDVPNLKMAFFTASNALPFLEELSSKGINTKDGISDSMRSLSRLFP